MTDKFDLITNKLLGSAAVTLSAVVVPHTKQRGEEAHLLCKYLEDGYDSLYSLKWYKDEVEFYR